MTLSYKREISKIMCYILRHNPSSVNMDDFGYVDIDELADSISNNYNKYTTKAEILEIANEDEKKRYKIFENKIKCNQGHSFKVIDAYEELNINTCPYTLYHGTTSKAFNSHIFEEGLKKMKRNYVHLSPSLETATTVAKRRKKDAVVITIDCKKMISDGVKVYKSENNVYLVDYIDPKYFTGQINLPYEIKVNTIGETEEYNNV